MSATDQSATTAGRRVVLLAGQAFALGLLMAWLLVPASAIFLDAYGSGLLPVTYIGAAIAGAASSAALGAAFRKRPLIVVGTRVLVGLSIFLLVSWATLSTWHAEWVSFAVLILVPIVVPVGFMFVVGQAGMLLDVRALKALYGRVVSGFALGFVAGGLAAPLLLSGLGSTEHLLVAATGAAVLFITLAMETRSRFAAELLVVEAPGDTVESQPTLWTLARDRYVMLIVAFQMLSAVESQWLDFLVYDAASDRYADNHELAQFVSRFTAIAYGADIVVLVVAAGFVLRRFGLRYGLIANSTGVLAVVGTIIVTTLITGSGATVVFVLIVAARVTDLVFSDATSRTSLSAAYQVVPGPLRLAAQARVEGLAVPVAIGASGVALLLLQATVGTDGLTLPVLTSVVVSAWVVVAVLLYRAYRVSLLASLRRRELDPAELSVDDPNSIAAIDRLLASDDSRDVRLGLDTLAAVHHPSLPLRLERLAEDRRVGVRVDALERLAQVDGVRAESVARAGLRDSMAEVRAASARVLAVVGDASDLPAVEEVAGDAAPDVRVAAVTAMVRIGDRAVRRRIADEIGALSVAPAPSERVLAARMLGACDSVDPIDRAGLRALLNDPHHEVANAALAAVRWPDDAGLVAEVIRCLHHRATAAAAMDALAGGDDAVLTAIDEALRPGDTDRRVQELLTRAARTMGGPNAREILMRHVDHVDREVGLAVLSALAAIPAPVRGGNGSSPHADLGPDLEHASHLVRALLVFNPDQSTELLRSALRDELSLVRERVLAAMATRPGGDEVHRVVLQLAQDDTRSHALALEWLDVTLSGSDRATVALLDPVLSDEERFRALAQWFPLDPITRDELLRDLCRDTEGRWRRPWLQACALRAAWTTSESKNALGDVWPDGVDADAVLDEDNIVHETVAALWRDR